AGPTASGIAGWRGARGGGGKRRPTTPKNPAPPADEIAGELDIPPLVPEANFWCAAGKIVDAHVARLEQYCSAVGEALFNQILYHLLLAVNGHALADEIAEIDVMQGAAEREIDAVVEHAFAPHADAGRRFEKGIARPLPDQPGADAALDVAAAAILQDHALHRRAVEQMREHQPGGPGAHNTDLRAQLTLGHPAIVSRTRDRRLCPLPVGERATLFCNIKERVRGFASIRSAG